MFIKRRLILSPILKWCWVHFKYTTLILMICCLLVCCLTSSGKYFMHIQGQNNMSVCVLNLIEANIVWLLINHYFVYSNFLLQHTFHQCIRTTSGFTSSHRMCCIVGSNFCFLELSLWHLTKRVTLVQSGSNVTCSHHDIAEKLPIWR